MSTSDLKKWEAWAREFDLDAAEQSVHCHEPADREAWNGVRSGALAALETFKQAGEDMRLLGREDKYAELAEKMERLMVIINSSQCQPVPAADSPAGEAPAAARGIERWLEMPSPTTPPEAVERSRLLWHQVLPEAANREQGRVVHCRLMDCLAMMKQGSAACRRLEEVDVFARAVEEMDANVRLLQEHLESEDARAWEPRKLSVSLMSAHGNLIRSVDHLYDTYGADLKDLCLQFPEIVVVGGESVGKSSLLEKLAGVPIFPRGDGITTRVPFRLRLHHRSAREMAALLAQVPDGGHGADVLMRFGDESSYISDVDTVRRRAQERNKSVRDSGRGVEDAEVVLNMYSSNFPDLTLLDLPGIIRSRGPTDPKSIAQICESLVKKYINNSDTIILAVLNACERIRGNEGIRLVQDIEAEKRTVAVLTKVDRACQLDTDVAGILREDTDLQLPHLGHRYHAIISRDTQRGSSGNRAKRDSCRRFSAAKEKGDIPAMQELLADPDAVSEEELEKYLLEPPAGEAWAALTETVGQRLEELRRKQDNFEESFFEAPDAHGSLSAFQAAQKVQADLVDASLQPFLGSRKLADRLSDMLRDHIKETWAPRLLQKMGAAQRKVLASLRSCGEAPPAEVSATAPEVAAFTEAQLAKMRAAVSERLVGAEGHGRVQLEREVVQMCHAEAQPQLYRLSQRCSATGHQGDFSAKVREEVNAFAQRVMSMLHAKLEAAMAAEEEKLRIARFPDLVDWVKGRSREYLAQRWPLVCKKLADLLAALEPDVYLPSVHHDRIKLQEEVVATVVQALPRVLVAHALRPYLQEFLAVSGGRSLLTNPGECLVREANDNVAKRDKALRQHEALKGVRLELEKYNVSILPASNDADDSDFSCPLTLTVMKDPVIAADGFTYERSAIEEHITRTQQSSRTMFSPMTNQPLPTLYPLHPNHALRSKIREAAMRA